MKKLRYNQKGFSLLELILVLAVMAIIMYFLLPALKNLREKGRQGVCVNNLKELHRGFMLYAADYNGWIPPAVYWDESQPPTGLNPNGTPTYPGDVWDYMIGPYVYKEYQVGPTISAAMTLQCPTYLLQHRDYGTIERTYAMPATWAGSVIINVPLSLATWPHMDKVVDPMNTILLAEVTRTAIPSTGGVGEAADIFNDLSNLDNQRHGAGANYLFVDGHVKFMTPGQAEDDSTYNLWL